MTTREYDASEAVLYHYGKFPPRNLDYARIAPALARASAALARYDALLNTLHSSEILLAPLRRREAVISSRIEGTIATLDEILKYEADEVDASESADDEIHYRREVLEVFSYARAMNHAQNLMRDGLPISSRLLKNTHSRLLIFGRGADKQPGEFKAEQNYVVDSGRKKILFVPVDMANFDRVVSEFEKYVNADDPLPLLQTAIAHAEFESIHPFKDGNGRLGRILITLMLWNRGLISAPHFYISGCIETQKDQYLDLLRAVSENDAWTEWCEFFLDLISRQAMENVEIANKIRTLYETMKDVFRSVTASRWSINALDFVFSTPVFRNSRFTKMSGIPKQTAHRITTALQEGGLLTVIEPASGRRPALFAFEPLLSITRV
jgi:Fic family protein